MTGRISINDVRRIAKLARLGLTDQEIKSATKDLADVLDNFARIQQVDTTNVPTSDDVTGRQNISREDTADPEGLCGADQLMANAPATARGHFKVKAVFDDPARDN